MDPITIMNALAMGTQAIGMLTTLAASLRKALSEEIPDEQLALESMDETVARLKASGKLPQDYQLPV